MEITKGGHKKTQKADIELVSDKFLQKTIKKSTEGGRRPGNVRELAVLGAGMDWGEQGVCREVSDHSGGLEL